VWLLCGASCAERIIGLIDLLRVSV
jgi:hypothetical protein